LTWLPVESLATAEPLPIREPLGQLVGLLCTTDCRQLANFELPKTMFLSKWMTARLVAPCGRRGLGRAHVAEKEYG